ncbi:MULTISPECIES: GNAT family N-acetyltransferase, partial [unclassified Staphylococcus]|uniref:GNAT family N-acetyltransferase n=2 Tax=Staphylococcus TaxID=1279 RepID=UPI0009F5BD85
LAIFFTLQQNHINRIEIRMSTKNKKSRAIPIRLGFTQEGILRSNERLQGEFSDSYVFSLLREECTYTR